MFLAIAATCLICAACCSCGLDLANKKHGWWDAVSWTGDHVGCPGVPMRAQQVYFFGETLISAAFVFIGLWASSYEKHLGRPPVLTALCFFIAFISAACSVILAKRAVLGFEMRRLHPNGR